jgi:hypothetical protein
MKREITCDKCNGSGHMELPEALAETLDSIPRRGTVTAFYLHGKLPGVTPNAQNNRLEKLRELGFLKRERSGKFWLYSRI